LFYQPKVFPGLRQEDLKEFYFHLPGLLMGINGKVGERT
jgi:hypothetical protein